MKGRDRRESVLRHVAFFLFGQDRTLAEWRQGPPKRLLNNHELEISSIRNESHPLSVPADVITCPSFTSCMHVHLPILLVVLFPDVDLQIPE